MAAYRQVSLEEQLGLDPSEIPNPDQQAMEEFESLVTDDIHHYLLQREQQQAPRSSPSALNTAPKKRGREPSVVNASSSNSSNGPKPGPKKKARPEEQREEHYIDQSNLRPMSNRIMSGEIEVRAFGSEFRKLSPPVTIPQEYVWLLVRLSPHDYREQWKSTLEGLGIKMGQKPPAVLFETLAFARQQVRQAVPPSLAEPLSPKQTLSRLPADFFARAPFTVAHLAHLYAVEWMSIQAVALAWSSAKGKLKRAPKHMIEGVNVTQGEAIKYYACMLTSFTTQNEVTQPTGAAKRTEKEVCPLSEEPDLDFKNLVHAKFIKDPWRTPPSQQYATSLDDTAGAVPRYAPDFKFILSKGKAQLIECLIIASQIHEFIDWTIPNKKGRVVITMDDLRDTYYNAINYLFESFKVQDVTEVIISMGKLCVSFKASLVKEIAKAAKERAKELLADLDGGDVNVYDVNGDYSSDEDEDELDKPREEDAGFIEDEGGEEGEVDEEEEEDVDEDDEEGRNGKGKKKRKAKKTTKKESKKERKKKEP